MTRATTAPRLLINPEEEEELRVENRVWRLKLAALEYTPGAALQGEIGASTVRGRDMKIKITFAQYMFRTRNGLLEGIF